MLRTPHVEAPGTVDPQESNGAWNACGCRGEMRNNCYNMNLKKNIFQCDYHNTARRTYCEAVLAITGQSSRHRCRHIRQHMVILSDVQIQDDIKSTYGGQPHNRLRTFLKGCRLYRYDIHSLCLEWCKKSTQRIQKTSVFFRYRARYRSRAKTAIKVYGWGHTSTVWGLCRQCDISVCWREIKHREVLDEFEGVTSSVQNVASGILADKPATDNGSIKQHRCRCSGHGKWLLWL